MLALNFWHARTHVFSVGMFTQIFSEKLKCSSITSAYHAEGLLLSHLGLITLYSTSSRKNQPTNTKAGLHFRIVGTTPLPFSWYCTAIHN